MIFPESTSALAFSVICLQPGNKEDNTLMSNGMFPILTNGLIAYEVFAKIVLICIENKEKPFYLYKL
jgi:hypothetical protein